MTPRDGSSSAGESEDDAPETFTFASSKKTAESAEHARKELEANIRRMKKEANRERDRRLKERAAEKEKEQEAIASPRRTTRRKGEKAKNTKQPVTERSEDESEGEDGAEPKSELEARMERAMREAELESDEYEGESESEEEDRMGSEWSGVGDEAEASANEQGDSSDEDDQTGSDSESDGDAQDSGSEADSDEEEPAPRRKIPQAPTYLPDDLFKAAFSKTPSKRRLDTEDEPVESNSRPRKQRRRPKRSETDITVGSRTIRTLTPANPAVPTTIPRAMVPPPNVNKFVKRSLNLKGRAQAAQIKGWERRKANVGVMKRNGPAASFARNGGYS